MVIFARLFQGGDRTITTERSFRLSLTQQRRLHIGRREIAVTNIIDRWLDPTHRYFNLRGDAGGIDLLRLDRASYAWELTLFDSGRCEDTRLSST